MRSSIKITFQDVHGTGIEPVIDVQIFKSDDPRDGLLSTLFQSVSGQEFLQFKYTDHIHTAVNGLPDMDKRLILFKPKINTYELGSIVRMCFYEWLAQNKYTANPSPDLLITYSYGDKNFTEDELFSKFVAEKASHKER